MLAHALSLPLYLSASLSLQLCFCLSGSISLPPSFSLSGYLFLLSIYLSVCLSVSFIDIHVCLSKESSIDCSVSCLSSIYYVIWSTAGIDLHLFIFSGLLFTEVELMYNIVLDSVVQGSDSHTYIHTYKHTHPYIYIHIHIFFFSGTFPLRVITKFWVYLKCKPRHLVCTLRNEFVIN